MKKFLTIAILLSSTAVMLAQYETTTAQTSDAVSTIGGTGDIIIEPPTNGVIVQPPVEIPGPPYRYGRGGKKGRWKYGHRNKDGNGGGKDDDNQNKPGS